MSARRVLCLLVRSERCGFLFFRKLFRGGREQRRQRAAQSLLKKLNLHDRIAQLVFAVADGEVFSTKSPEYERYRRLVRDVPIGGLIVNNATEFGIVRNADPHAMAVFLN